MDLGDDRHPRLVGRLDDGAADSLALATVMDDVRSQIGLTYPGEGR